MKERPILFSAPMVRAILEGRKTQTRRILNSVTRRGPLTEVQSSDTPGYDIIARDRHALWNDFTFADLKVRCPYGKPGDLLWSDTSSYGIIGDSLNDDCSEGDNEHGLIISERDSVETDTCLPERRLPGRVGRVRLFSDEVQGVREKGVCGLVPAIGTQNAQGVSIGESLPRERESDEECSPASLHGISRDAESRLDAGEALRREPGEQYSSESCVGDSRRELERPQGARDGDRGGEASRFQIERQGEGAPSLGDIKGPLQSTPSSTSARNVSVSNTKPRRQGDRLWVKESWAVAKEYDRLPPSEIPFIGRLKIWYPADGTTKPDWAGRIRSPRFMPPMGLTPNPSHYRRESGAGASDQRGRCHCRGNQPYELLRP